MSNLKLFFLFLRCLWACVMLFFVVLFGMNEKHALKLKEYTEKLQRDCDKVKVGES